MCVYYTVCNGATPGTMRIERERCCFFFFFVPNAGHKSASTRVLPSPFSGAIGSQPFRRSSVRIPPNRATYGAANETRSDDGGTFVSPFPRGPVSFVRASRRKSAISWCVKKKRENNEKTGRTARTRRHNLRRVPYSRSRFPSRARI